VPSYDPAIRGGGGGSVGSTGGQSTAAVPKPPNTVNNDLIIVTGNVNTGVQINPPDGTWTRINGIVSGFQTFWKRASGEPANWTFTWDGVNRAYTFSSLAAYSQGGGTVSLDVAVTSQVNSANSKTSDAVTPSANALVLISYLEFVISEPGPPTNPGGLTSVQAVGGFGFPTFRAGYIYIASGAGSGTFTSNNNAGDPGSNWFWGSGTFSLISSIVNPASPPLIDDEVVFAPATSQTFLPPFIDDEVVFAPTTGIGAMHTTTVNAEVAFRALAGGNLRVTTENAELAIQHLLSATNLRATQVTAEIALQALPPVSPVDFEIQTPGIILDSAQQETGNRLLLGVNCNISGVPQILTPILIIDGVEYILPRITSMSRVIIDMPIHGFHGRFWEGVRLTGRLTGRVEVFLVDISTRQGVPSPRGG